MDLAVGIIDREWIVSCPKCGKSYYSSVVRCGICKNTLQTPVARTSVQVQDEASHSEQIEYAGFLIRAVAYIMDQIMVWLTLIILGMSGYIALEAGAYIVNISAGELRLMIAPLIIAFCITTYGIYYTFYHGYYGQTVGKMLMGLKVTRTNGDELSYGVAFKRWMAYFASSFLFCFGFFMPIFTQRRQALHDKIVDTVVIRV